MKSIVFDFVTSRKDCEVQYSILQEVYIGDIFGIDDYVLNTYLPLYAGHVSVTIASLFCYKELFALLGLQEHARQEKYKMKFISFFWKSY